MADEKPAKPDKKNNFSTKAFLQGLGVVFLCLLALGIWIFVNAGKIEKAISQKLASQTVIIEWQSDDQTAAAQNDPQMTPEQSPETSENTVLKPKEYAPAETLESGLVAAPIDGLHEQTTYGRKPVLRESDGLTAFKAYRRPYDIYATKKPIIAIAINGLGLSDIATESAMRSMPPEISFILSPYSEALSFWVSESRQRGHEVWLSLPLEAQNYPIDDPGPHTMLINAPERENQLKMEWLLSQAQGYIGFVTNYQPTFLTAANDMRPVIGNIYNSGLGFVDGSQDPGLIPQTMAVGMKAPYSTIDIWVDIGDSSPVAINSALKALEAQARDKGFAVGVIHPLPVSFQQVLSWIKTLPDKGLELAPLSATTGM